MLVGGGQRRVGMALSLTEEEEGLQHHSTLSMDYNHRY